MNWTVLAAAAVMGAVASAPAAAQERAIPLDTVRVDASSRAASELASPTRAVQVVTAAEIRTLSARTVGEVLQWSLGVDLMSRSPASVDVALRGSTFEQVLVLVNGVRVSDTQTGHFDLDLAVPLEQIERIEVLRGAGSALHGSDAVGGVINVVTRESASGPSGRVEAGSFGTAGAAAAAAFRPGATRVDVAGEMRRSDGHREGTEYEILQARVAVHAPLASRSLRADLGHASRDFGADGFYAPFPSYEETRTTTATVRLLPAASANFSLEPLVSVRRHADDFILDRNDPSFSRNRHTSWQTGAELLARMEAAERVSLAGGVEVYHDRLESNNLGDREETRTAAMVEVAAGSVGRLSGTAGLRGDWHSRYGGVASPSASVAWWPASGLRLRGSAGTAFRAPTWTERYYRDPANIGDPELAPERSWNAELGADMHLAPGVSLGGGVFYRDASDLIDWAKPAADEQQPWRTRNVEKARFRGAEAVLGMSEMAGFDWSLRGEWLSFSTSESTGFVSKSALRPVLQSLTLRAGRAVTERLSVTALAQQTRRTAEDAHYRLDLKAGYRLRDFRIYADLRNATDERFLDITRSAAPGRSLFVGIELLP